MLHKVAHIKINAFAINVKYFLGTNNSRLVARKQKKKNSARLKKKSVLDRLIKGLIPNPNARFSPIVIKTENRI